MVKKKTVYQKHKWKLVVVIFIFSLLIRLWNFNGMGRTWDEASYVEVAYKYVQLVQNNNFSDPFWYIQSDHPPLARYLFAAVSKFDIEKFDKFGNPIYFYNFTFARLVSTILSCISAIFIFLIGSKFFSRFIGIISAVIFSLIPFFLGFSHTGTLEALIMFTYTGSLYFFLKFLSDKRKISLILTGIFLGLGLLTKFTNIFILVTFIAVYLVWYIYNKKKAKASQIIYHLLLIIFVALITSFVLWPMAWLHLPDIWKVQNAMRFSSNLSIPEDFFGKLMLVPVPYYPIMFLITTPLTLLTLSLIGVLGIDKKRTWIGLSILIWFLIPFFQTFYHFRQHGVRYIIEIYAPFTLLCGIGFDYFVSRYTKKILIKTILFIPIVIYLFIILLKITPYYLDYFNEVVGGNNYVYKHKLFQMGWWGQGIGEATFYISNHERNTVTVAVDGQQPMGTMPRLKNIKIVDLNSNRNADYIIVPYFNIVRLGFKEEELFGKYKVVYVVHIDRAELVKVYKKLSYTKNWF